MAGPTHAGSILYGVNQEDNLISINTTTGAGALVQTISPSMGAIGLAATGGKLYAFDTNNGNVLDQLDPNSSSPVATVNVGFTGSDTLAEGDLAFRSDGTGFVVSTLLADGSFDLNNGSLFSLDLAGNSHTLIKDSFGAHLSGLAFSPTSGDLFGLDTGGTTLYKIDPSNGNLTVVGSTGLVNGRCCLGGLAFASNGTLYAGLADFANSTLYTIDTTTGQATSIGDIGFDSVSGLAFFDTNAPPPAGAPEPSTGVLLLAVPLLWLGRGRLFSKQTSTKELNHV
jgi:hypothetical protein